MEVSVDELLTEKYKNFQDRFKPFISKVLSEEQFVSFCHSSVHDLRIHLMNPVAALVRPMLQNACDGTQPRRDTLANLSTLAGMNTDKVLQAYDELPCISDGTANASQTMLWQYVALFLRYL